MKFLMARVGEKVEGLQGASAVTGEKHEVEPGSQAKLAALLEKGSSKS